jgi:hypothetical protein
VLKELNLSSSEDNELKLVLSNKNLLLPSIVFVSVVLIAPSPYRLNNFIVILQKKFVMLI